MVEYSSLRVIESNYVAGDKNGFIRSIGNGLISKKDINAGQSIIDFNGTLVKEHTVKDWNMRRRQFLIHLHGEDYLDCMEHAKLGICIGSMANTANKLYDSKNRFQLDASNNNAAVKRTGDEGATLYAMVKIPKNTEILWDYGDEYFTNTDVDDYVFKIGSNTPFNENYITWDCASGMNIIKDRKWAFDILNCDTRSLAGIVDSENDKSNYNETCSMMDKDFGRCALAINATSNILSQSRAVDRGFIVEYMTDKDKYKVTNPNNNKVYQFGRMESVVDGRKHCYYVMDMRTGNPPTVIDTPTYCSNH